MNDIQIFNDDLASIALKAKETNEVHVYEHPLFGKVRMFVETVRLGSVEWILLLLYSMQIHQKQL